MHLLSAFRRSVRKFLRPKLVVVVVVEVVVVVVVVGIVGVVVVSM